MATYSVVNGLGNAADYVVAGGFSGIGQEFPVPLPNGNKLYFWKFTFSSSNVEVTAYTPASATHLSEESAWQAAISSVGIRVGSLDQVTVQFDTTDLTGGAIRDSYLQSGGAVNWESFVAKLLESGDVVTGSDNENILQGWQGDDSILGGAGNDLLEGGQGSDTLIGSLGNDTLMGQTGSDNLQGGDGNDFVLADWELTGSTTEGGKSYLSGGDGDDTLAGYYGNDTFDGGKGNDWVVGGQGHDSALGGDGNDTLSGSFGNDTITGDAGDDLISGGVTNDTNALGGFSSVTTSASTTDEIVDDHDVLSGNGGNDTVFGDSGNDVIFGNVGNDSLDGGYGNDVLSGDDAVSSSASTETSTTASDGTATRVATDDDTLLGGAGNDSLATDQGRDSLVGGDGNDTLTSGADDDKLYGDDAPVNYYTATGNDSLSAGDGNDALWGGNGNDTLSGDAGNDSLSGDTGTNYLTGKEGDDLLVGGYGNDAMLGGDGHDILIGAGGSLFEKVTTAVTNEEYYGNSYDFYRQIADALKIEVPDKSTVESTTYEYEKDNASSGPNLMYGGTGNDSIVGGYGSDTLVGGSGVDTLAGGAGNDAYLIALNPRLPGATNSGNLQEMVLIQESSDHGGGGVDTVYSESSFILPNAVENLWLMEKPSITQDESGLFNSVDALKPYMEPDQYGYQANRTAEYEKENALGSEPGNLNSFVTGTGNELNNEIYGNSGKNVLMGADGDDLLVGRAGNDTLDGGMGADSLSAGDGADSLVGGTGDDVLWGGEGVDTLLGGDGSDTFRLYDARQVLADYDSSTDEVDWSLVGADQVKTLDTVSTSATQGVLDAIKASTSGEAAAIKQWFGDNAGILEDKTVYLFADSDGNKVYMYANKPAEAVQDGILVTGTLSDFDPTAKMGNAKAASDALLSLKKSITSELPGDPVVKDGNAQVIALNSDGSGKITLTFDDFVQKDALTDSNITLERISTQGTVEPITISSDNITVIPDKDSPNAWFGHTVEITLPSNSDFFVEGGVYRLKNNVDEEGHAPIANVAHEVWNTTDSQFLFVTDNVVPVLDSATASPYLTNSVTLDFNESVGVLDVSKIHIKQVNDDGTLTGNLSVTLTSKDDAVSSKGQLLANVDKLDSQVGLTVKGLVEGKTYAVVMDQGAVSDLAGKDIAASSDDRFVFPDNLRISSMSPVNGNTSASASDPIVLTMDSNVDAAALVAGGIHLVSSDGAVINATAKVTGVKVSISHDALDEKTAYSLNIDANSIQSTADKDGVVTYFSGGHILDFTTVGIPPHYKSSAGLGDNTNSVSLKTDHFSITFDESVSIANASGITLLGSDKSTIKATSSLNDDGSVNVAINGKLVSSVTYTVQVAKDSIVDLKGTAADAGKLFNFKTEDTIAPTLTSTTPADNAKDVAANSTITLTFSEDVKADSTLIHLVDASKKEVAAKVVVTGDHVDITPTKALTDGAAYSLTFDKGAVIDIAGNQFAGALASDKNGYGFTIVDKTAPKLTDVTPDDAGKDVSVDTKTITMTFNEAITIADAKKITLVDSAGKSVAATSAVGKDGQSVVLTLKDGVSLAEGTTYQVTIGKGSITDISGNAFDATKSDVIPGGYDFTTITLGPKPVNLATVGSGHTSDDPVVYDAGTGDYAFTSDASMQSAVIVMNFNEGDTISLSKADYYPPSIEGTSDVVFTASTPMADGSLIESQIRLTGVLDSGVNPDGSGWLIWL